MRNIGHVRVSGTPTLDSRYRPTIYYYQTMFLSKIVPRVGKHGVTGGINHLTFGDRTRYGDGTKN